MNYLTTILLLLPAIIALLIGFAPEKNAKGLALGGSILTLLVSLGLLGYNNSGELFQFTTLAPWLPNLANYHVGVDGTAVLLILLATFLQVCVVWYSQDTIKERVKEYYLWIMLLEATVIGAFISMDVILFYVFFEAALVPSYFLVGIWGGKHRVQAATKFFVYTVVGSLLMLAAIIGLFLYSPSLVGTNDGGLMSVTHLSGKITGTAGLLMFAGFAVAFAVKTGLFPFHTWLPDTYAEAPAPVTALLSGILAKLGTFGFYRFCLFLFPEAAQQLGPFLVGMGVVSIVYGALIAAVQRDAKRVIAYSSVSHLGFVVAGMFALNTIAASGAVLQMVNHGITSGALFLILGMIEQRRGTTVIRSLGGLWEQMPVFGRLFLIVTLSSIGLPLTNGFAGEFLILLGTFQTQPWLAAIASTGVIWSAVYMLWMFQRVMYGPVDRPATRRLRDIAGPELGLLVPFIVLIFLLGVFPSFVLRKADLSVKSTVGPIAVPATTTPVAAAVVGEQK
jgi:NADH-quinone oxidoreductase subunit M